MTVAPVLLTARCEMKYQVANMVTKWDLVLQRFIAKNAHILCNRLDFISIKIG